MKRNIFIGITVLLCLAMIGYLYTLKGEVKIQEISGEKTSQNQVAIVFGALIVDSDLGSTDSVGKGTKLSLIIENSMRNNLASLYDINTSDTEIEKWLRSKKPELLSNNILGRGRQEAQKIYDALLLVQTKELSAELAYKKYLQDSMGEEGWQYVQAQFPDEAALEELKKEINKSNQELIKQAVGIYRIEYILDEVEKKLCSSAPIKGKVAAAAAKEIIKYGNMQSGMSYIEEAAEQKGKSICHALALEQLVRLQKEQVSIIDPKYSEALFKTHTYSQWKFLERSIY